MTSCDEPMSADPSPSARGTRLPMGGADSFSKPSTPGCGPHLSSEQVVNRLNFLNFYDRPLMVRFRHTTLDRWLILTAIPEPCRNRQVTYLWSPAAPPPRLPPQYRFCDILMEDGDGLIVLQPPAHHCHGRGGTFTLPPTGLRINARRSRRFLCVGVKAEVIQNSARFHGALIDFSPFSLMVRLDLALPQTFSWIAPDTPVHLVLGDDQEIVFAGECRIIRHQWGPRTGTCVLQPTQRTIPRFQRKRHRSRRVNVRPCPNLVFTHPLTGKRVELPVRELSGAGFSAEMYRSQDVLLPGMIIRRAQLVFACGSTFDCRLQVIHTHRAEGAKTPFAHSGFAILDIPARQHTRLLALLYQVREPDAYINQSQDMEALWRFFFETGFIYPDKYAFFHQHKAGIQAMYEKLYTRHPSFARHFTYQRMGRVLGHMSMLRFYSRAWLIQHHAASTVECFRAGLIVLEHIGRFINDSHRLGRIRMDYVFCLFRPQNKFPSRVFGGAAKQIGDPQACSQDTFAYLHLPLRPMENLGPAGPDWRLVPAEAEDLAELMFCRTNEDGDLLLRAFDLTPENYDLRTLSAEYRAIGFRRERRLFALRRQGQLAAVLVANRADFGLNMSDLTNAIQMFVVDPQALPPHVVRRALGRIAACYPKGPVPLMVYPATAASAFGLAKEKRYTVWVLNLEHTDSYFDYISRLLRGTRRQDSPATANGPTEAASGRA